MRLEYFYCQKIVQATIKNRCFNYVMMTLLISPESSMMNDRMHIKPLKVRLILLKLHKSISNCYGQLHQFFFNIFYEALLFIIKLFIFLLDFVRDILGCDFHTFIVMINEISSVVLTSEINEVRYEMGNLHCKCFVTFVDNDIIEQSHLLIQVVKYSLNRK